MSTNSCSPKTCSAFLFRHLLPVALAATALLGGLPAAKADIYVSEQTSSGTNDIIGRFTNAGTAVNTSFLTGQNAPYDLALSGGNLYVLGAGLNGGSTANSGSLRVYNATTGAAVNTSFITALNGPTSIELGGGFIYVGFDGNFGGSQGSVGKFNLATGTVVNASFITGINYAEGLALSGNTLYVSRGPSHIIGSYDATTGAAINANLVSGLGSPEDIKISGNTLYIMDNGKSQIGTYNATTGAVINASFITGVPGWGMDLVGNNLYVANGNGTIGEYNATTGAAINASLVTGLNADFGVAVTPAVPEPTSVVLLGAGALLMVGARRWRRRVVQ